MVGGRLRHFLRAWQDVTDDRYVLSIIKDGYRLEFERLPPLSHKPRYIRLPSSSVKRVALWNEVQVLLAKNAIRQVPADRPGPGFYSHLFLVEKKTGGWRPVLDLSSLNRFIRKESFQMLTPQRAMGALSLGDWSATIDLKDAYFHIPIHRLYCRYLRFAMEGKIFEFVALPFGLTSAPRVFTRVLSVVVSQCHLQSINVLAYIDDWLLHNPCSVILSDNVGCILHLFARLGFVVSESKSRIIPTQEIAYLGMDFDTSRGIVRPSLERCRSLVLAAQGIRRRTVVSARSFLRLLGCLVSVGRLVPWGVLHRRPLQLYLMSLWNATRQPLEATIPIRASIQPHLQWWEDFARLRTGVLLAQQIPDRSLYTDASKQGWGAHLFDSQASGRWTEAEQLNHINWLELEAVRLALLEFADLVTNHTMLVRLDNSTVVSYINHSTIRAEPGSSPCVS